MSRGRPRILTPDDVREVRRWHAQRKALPTVKAMARKMGVEVTTLRHIRTGNTYKDVK